MRSPLQQVPATPASDSVAQHAHVKLAESNLDRAIETAAVGTRGQQRSDGHWVFELEADATISAGACGSSALSSASPIRRSRRRSQTICAGGKARIGGWPLYHGGDFDLSASVKVYLALKLVGDSPEIEHMRRAREAILARGGAGRSNVFTRFLLALFGALPWASVPIVPFEIMLLPRWFPFHLSRVSYWSRTVLVPLLVLAALKPRARNPRGIRIDELLHAAAPRALRWVRANHQSPAWFAVFAATR
jgi:squalene-hopene/tetraprenyl-beta-curcumene cyclase